MVALRKPTHDAASFIDWYLRQPKEAGTCELWDGEVVMHAGNTVGHADMKFDLVQALKNSIAKGRLPCRAYVDGPLVKISNARVFQPDAIVVCGPPPPPETAVIDAPLIVCEVVSPSSFRRDHVNKVIAYFTLPSIMHYLIVDPAERHVVHHRRVQGSAHETTIHTDGLLKLDPPNLEFDVAALFPPIPPTAAETIG
ncbi:MAG: hypothetical protein RL291_1985 [Pseudomonadota bacterium]